MTRAPWRGPPFLPIYRWSELDSRERNVCGLCGASDADFTLDLDDKDDGLTWAAGRQVRGQVPVLGTSSSR